MLKAVMKDFDNVYLVVDALDECPKLDGERAKLLALIDEIRSWDLSCVHLLTTSRLEEDIVDFLDKVEEPVKSRTVKVEGSCVEEDTKKFVNSQLQCTDFRYWTKEVKDLVLIKLPPWSNGM